jgi:hypothetical protein
MFRVVIGTLGLAVCCRVMLAATSYEAVTFNDLVERADLIFIGQVVDVHPYPSDVRGETLIKTRVTFSVADPLWGTSSLVEVLDFLGGEWNGVGMRVAGMPTFAVGDRRVIFARHDRSINPIVGFTQGLLRVEPDGTGIDRVFTSDRQPLSRVENIGVAQVFPPQQIAMRVSELHDRITRALAARSRR